MKPKTSEPGWRSRSFRCLIAVLSVAFLSAGSPLVFAQETQPQSSPPAPTAPAPPAEEAPKIPNDQLDSLVAPIALYPDPLLAQTLAASTYPLELIQLQQWMQKNKNLKGKALADAVAKQPWDPSVQSMAGIPDAVERLAGNIQWTTDLGNAFLAQQQDVMDAVQRMRAKAQGKGALKTSQQQTVETKTVQGNKEVIVIQQPNPEVVYVPSYDPAVVYGPPAYPYYPYTYPGYVPGMGLALGTGIALGIGWANNWGNCDWNNGGDININNNNNFNRNTNVNRSGGGNNKWQHDGKHRGGAPYSNRSTANKYGGTARGDSLANRQTDARQRPSDPGGSRRTNRPGGDDRRRIIGPAATDNNQPPETAVAAATNQVHGSQSSGGGDRIGNREVSRSPSSRNTSAFGGSSGGIDRSSARASSSRGSHSMGASRERGRFQRWRQKRRGPPEVIP